MNLIFDVASARERITSATWKVRQDFPNSSGEEILRSLANTENFATPRTLQTALMNVERNLSIDQQGELTALWQDFGKALVGAILMIDQSELLQILASPPQPPEVKE